MSKIHWTDVWKGPFKYDEGGDVYSKDNVWVFTPDISLDYDDPEIMKLIADITEVLNTGEELKEKYTGMEIVADIDMMEDIYQLKRAKVDKKNAEDIVKEYEDKIKKAMGASDKVVNNMGDTLLTWKESTRTTFDEKRFSLDYPDIYTKYLVNTKVSRTFRVR